MDDDNVITEADLAEARERWADPKHESTVGELFSTPAYGKGFRGDNPIASPEKHAESDRQRKPWTCGPATLRWAAERLGIPQTETDLAESADSDPDEGTSPANLAGAAKAAGMLAEARHNMTIPQLGRECVMGKPVLCCIQAAENDADDLGHWIAVQKAGLSKVTYFDPADGKTKSIPVKEFVALWRDRGASGVPYKRFGIVLSKSPEKAATYAEVPTFGHPINVTVHVPPMPAQTINVDARQEPAIVNVTSPDVYVAAPNVTVSPTVEGPRVTVLPAPVTFAEREHTGPQEVIIVGMPERVTEAKRDHKGDLTGKTEKDATE